MQGKRKDAFWYSSIKRRENASKTIKALSKRNLEGGHKWPNHRIALENMKYKFSP